MNINSQILELKLLTNLSVTPDTYTGTDESWITFTYEDERPEEFGDDAPISDTAYIQINLFTPGGFNYMSLKDTIKNYLESIGTVPSVISRVYEYNSKLIRQTSFEAEITEGRP